MRSIFLFVVSVALAPCVFGDDNPPSVLKRDNPPAATAIAPAPAVVSPTVIVQCDNCVERTQAQPQLICVNGRCGSQRLYSVDARDEEWSRNRLFGGQVIRRHTRTVVRPVR